MVGEKMIEQDNVPGGAQVHLVKSERSREETDKDWKPQTGGLTWRERGGDLPIIGRKRRGRQSGRGGRGDKGSLRRCA